MGLPRGFISSQITDNSSFLLKDLLSLPISAAAEVSLWNAEAYLQLDEGA